MSAFSIRNADGSYKPVQEVEDNIAKIRAAGMHEEANQLQQALDNKRKFIREANSRQYHKDIEASRARARIQARKRDLVVMRDTMRERFRSSKRRAVVYLGDKCVRCGQQYPDCVYDFHHLHGKDRAVSDLLTSTWATLEAELNKCQLVCSNCHRIIHMEERHGSEEGSIGRIRED